MKLQDQIDKVTKAGLELHNRAMSVVRANRKADILRKSADLNFEIHILSGMIKKSRTREIVLYILLIGMFLINVIKGF